MRISDNAKSARNIPLCIKGWADFLLHSSVQPLKSTPNKAGDTAVLLRVTFLEAFKLQEVLDQERV